VDKAEVRDQNPEKRDQAPARGRDAISRLVFFLSIIVVSSCSFSLPKIIVLNDPLTPEEHINLGIAYQENGEKDSAVTEFQAASKKLPDAYLYLGNLYFENNDLEKAEQSYRMAITKKSSLADAYNNLAWLYYTKKQNLKEARSLAEKAIEIHPQNQIYQDTLLKINELITLQGL
jgi:tetratricopeptide (TPR) repeat protein